MRPLRDALQPDQWEGSIRAACITGTRFFINFCLCLSRRRKTLLAIMAGTGIAVSVGAGGELPSEPHVSKPLVASLKAAQQAIGKKQYDEALVDVNQAQAIDIKKTAYDNYVIDVLLIEVYQGKNDPPALIQSLQTAAQSPYVTADQQKEWYTYIARYDYQQKDYRSAIDAARKAVEHGANDDDTTTLIAKAQYFDGRYNDAERQMWEVVNKQASPTQDILKLLWQFSLKAGDTAGAAKALDKLNALYPRAASTEREREWLREEHIAETRPRHRDGPLRYLNISDDEVRQIQAAVASVMPQQFVSIGGVVTGCPPEEGSACTDQVWVEMRQPDRTVGLLLSKVNEQWVVGPIQRWWLCDEDLDAHRRSFSSYDAYLSAKRTLAAHFPQCVVTTAAAASP